MLAPLVLALLQPVTAYSSPPGGDTTGYWQQRADYAIVATLDETTGVLHAEGRLTYVNQSPDTLRELYVHQHLNAFRPASAWSAADEREGRVRFQALRDPHHAYERFTRTPAFDGVPVAPQYPGAPDSTVVRFPLPRPLAPGDTLRATFAWDARLSTLPRRQGRRGRSYDFAQWYPRVAVYDRGGWQANALRPAGEFYGEFGDFDVTLVLRDDQVLGTTGVVVEGDPGWERARRWGVVANRPDAYEPPAPAEAVASEAAADGPLAAAPAGERASTGDSAAVGDPAPTVDSVSTARAAATPDGERRADGRADTASTPGAARPPGPPVPAGHKRVRVLARDVHHFGWSVSPDYVYEGTYYLRPDSARATRFRTWDSVSVHVLYRPGDEATWGNGQVVARTNVALRWLESIFGPYAYPQMTVLHRIEGGGTEFPMLQMNGSPSQGLVLHEGGHVYAHGILANNEWRSGWMDEGLSSYQTAWAQGLTPQDRARQAPPPAVPPAAAGGYAARAVRPAAADLALVAQARLDLLGRTQPIGTPAHGFRDFGVYNAMVYGRAEHMFGALRDAMGDEAFRRFLRLYFDRWALRHVDERAMRAAARDAAGRDMDWFFEQWVHRTGVVDYALRDVRVRRDGEGWVTTARVVQEGDYRHPMPVGALVDTGWVLVRAAPAPRSQEVTVRTATEPRAVRLDPLRTTPDWYAPNDADIGGLRRWRAPGARVVLDWPLLEQSAADRHVTAVAPLAWYGRPGGATVALRARSNYLGTFDRREAGLAVATRLRSARTPPGPAPWTDAPPLAPKPTSRIQGWLSFENPKPWGRGRPLMGVAAGAWHLDGVTKAQVGRTWDRSPMPNAGPRVTQALTLTGTYPYERALLDGRRWSGRSATDLTWSWTRSPAGSPGTGWRLALTGGALAASDLLAGSSRRDDVQGYARGELSWSVARRAPTRRLSHHLRVHAGFASEAPPERALLLAAATPTATFASHLWRPDGGILSADDVPYRPLGGAGLRGYDPMVAARWVAALNLEEAVRVARFGPANRPLDLDLTLFADGAALDAAPGTPAATHDFLADAGVGLALRGMLFDRDVRLRLDVPLYVSEPALAVGARGRASAGADRRLRLRWAFSLADLW